MTLATAFANPYLVCTACGKDVLGTDRSGALQPCDHMAEAKSLCPTWSPVDGCVCASFLPGRAHGVRKIESIARKQQRRGVLDG